MKLKKSSILVVGLGSIGQRHARLLADRKDIELAICDSRQDNVDQFKKLLNQDLRSYADYADALKSKPDAVFICTPDSFHVPMGIQAVDAGADIFVEKPMANNLKDAKHLNAHAEKNGKLLYVGYMIHFDDGLLKLKAMLDAKKLGNIVAARAMMGSHIILLNAKDSFREKKENILLFDNTHEIDFLRWFFGDIKEVSATADCLGKQEKKSSPNIAQALMTMTSGILVQLHVDYVQYPQRRIFEIYGDEGTISYDFMTGEIRYFPPDREHRYENMDVRKIFDRIDKLYIDQIEAFLAARKGERQVEVSGRDGVAAVAVADAIIRAVQEKKCISVEL